MIFQKLKEEAGRVEKIISGWNEDCKISTIERELVLEKLRMIYEEVRFLQHGERSEITAGEEKSCHNQETESAGKQPIDRLRILSLYGSETMDESTEAERLPASDAAPEAEADVAEELSSDEKEPVECERHDDDMAAGQTAGLQQMIGEHDRFLLMRDLFDNDRAACDAAIERLDALPDLDEAMIYLHEHYAWNPDSEGVKRLVELLEQKFS